MTIMLNGSDLTVTDVVAAARHGESVALAPGAVETMEQARAVVEEVLAKDEPADGTLPADLEPLVELVSRGDLELLS